jgi:hypothetical protein
LSSCTIDGFSSRAQLHEVSKDGIGIINWKYVEGSGRGLDAGTILILLEGLRAVTKNLRIFGDLTDIRNLTSRM